MRGNPYDFKVKGHLLEVALEQVVSGWGREALERVIGSLKPEHQKHWRSTILASLWYPYPAFADLPLTADRLLCGGDGTFLREGGHIHARKLITGLHRFLFKFINIEKFFTRIPSAWKLNYNMGWVRVEGIEGGYLMEAGGFPYDYQYFRMNFIARL